MLGDKFCTNFNFFFILNIAFWDLSEMNRWLPENKSWFVLLIERTITPRYLYWSTCSISFLLKNTWKFSLVPKHMTLVLVSLTMIIFLNKISGGLLTVFEDPRDCLKTGWDRQPIVCGLWSHSIWQFQLLLIHMCLNQTYIFETLVRLRFHRDWHPGYSGQSGSISFDPKICFTIKSRERIDNFTFPYIFDQFIKQYCPINHIKCFREVDITHVQTFSQC